MEMCLVKASIFLIDGSATNTAYLTLTRQLWEKPFVFVSQLLKPDAWAFEGIANIIVCLLICTAKKYPNIEIYRLWHSSRYFG